MMSYARHEYRIVDVCEALHMAKSGAGELLNDEKRDAMLAALYERLTEWHQSDSAYDNAVYSLIVATLAEYGR